MPGPEFVRPGEASAAEAVEAIGEELASLDDWMDRYELIIDMGRRLPPYPDAWMDEAHRVQGCQSRVWLASVREDGRLWFAAASDAAIVSGLAALLLRVYSGRTREEILATDPAFLRQFGLIEALSTNRGNGIAEMARRVRETAAAEPVG
jgi:cysteine desulfuration protein SufE